MNPDSIQNLVRPLKAVLPENVWRLMRSVGTAIVTPIRFSRVTGHFKSSLKSKSVTQDGDPLPWYTYPAIDFLNGRSFEGKKVLEFGSGQSTLWWAQKAKRVVSIEDNFDWFRYVGANVGDNVDIHHVSLEDFHLIKDLLRETDDEFDIIVIDGHLRRQAVELAFHHLAKGGALILDNSEGYELYEETRDRECRRVDFLGFAPGVSLRHCTSIVYVDDCFLFSPNWPIQKLD